MREDESLTRQFTGVPRAHPLSYQYNLAGGLTRITDPFEAQVDYEHDRVGRVIEVTGAGAGSAPVYVSAIQYRAWGAARRVTYGNNVYAEVEYNTRLQPTRFEVRRTSGENPTIMLSTYQYHADGRIRFASNEQDHTFDRAYSFDHVGRLAEAYTAGEARNFRDNLSGGTTDGAYRQTYAHDEWDNLTERVGRFWTQYDSFGAAFNSQNRNGAWSYDAAGNVVTDETRVYVWDASGRNTYARQITDANRNLTTGYDGDGRRVKRVGLNASGQMETSYYQWFGQFFDRKANSRLDVCDETYVEGELADDRSHTDIRPHERNYQTPTQVFSDLVYDHARHAHTP